MLIASCEQFKWVARAVNGVLRQLAVSTASPRLATADPARGSQSVVCLDRRTGKVSWQTVVNGEGADPGKHSNSSAASSTVACDGERLYINFLNSGAVHTTALTLGGKVVWQQK